MNANIFSRKIEMTKAEAKAAGKIGSDKYEELRKYMKEFPGFEIQIKAPAKRKVEFRGLDYKFMREYIQKHDDANGTIMAEFRTLTAQDKKEKAEGSENLEAAGYLDVKKWFLAKFPEIKKFKEEHSKKVKEILAAA
jgi:hypothetical protein